MNHLIFKFAGFMLYPTTKCGKEKRNMELYNRYKKDIKDI